MQIIRYPNKADWKEIIQRPTQSLADIEQRVIPILDAVKQKGDKALKQFAKEFDKVEIVDLIVSQNELTAADNLVSEELKNAIKIAYNNIHTFHKKQETKPEVIETVKGIECWRKSVARKNAS